MDYMIVYGILLLCLVDVSHQQQHVAAQCLSTTTTGQALVFVIRANPNGNSAITGIQFYDASETDDYMTAITDTGCSTSTLTNGVYELTFGAESGGGTCGAVESGNEYEFALRTNGIDQYYVITCDLTDLQTHPTTVSETDYGTLHPAMHLEVNQGNPVDIQFDVFVDQGTNAPVDSVFLGQDLRLLAIYNQGYEEQGLTNNNGRSFHTAFLYTTASVEFYLEITTPGLGTLVDIEVGDGRWSRRVFVKRDEAAFVQIPNTYVTGTVSTTVWESKEEGVKITARDDRIGVQALTIDPTRAAPSKAERHIVLPDELLGDAYTVTTGLKDTANGQLALIFTETTVATFTFGSTDKPTTIAGENTGGGATFTLPTGIDGNSIIRVYCGAKCEHLLISAANPFAVIAGHNPTASDGIVATQLTPEDRLGDTFVLVDLPGGTLNLDYSYTFRATQAAATATSSAGATNIPDDDVEEINLSAAGPTATAYETTGPITVFQNVLRPSTNERTVLQYPSMSQWGIHQSFYAESGYSYDIIVVTEKGSTTDITVKTSVASFTTLGAIADFSGALTDVTPLSGPATHEMYAKTNFLVPSSSGYVELRSGSDNIPFMLLVTSYTSSGGFTISIPYGQRYPPWCTASGATIALNRGGFNYGNTVANVPGDNIDNDCDGTVDEEELNGKDDDGDTFIDEDVFITKNTVPLAIKAVELMVASDNTFTGPEAVKVIEDGCLTAAGSASFPDLGPFTHLTGLDDVYDDYWVLTSPKFDAFSLPPSTSIFFKIVVGFCGGDVTASTSACTSSCQVERRKRQVSEEETFTLVKRLDVKDGNITVVTVQDDSTTAHPCRLEPVFLVPAALLLMMILGESISLGYILTKKIQLRP